MCKLSGRRIGRVGECRKEGHQSCLLGHDVRQLLAPVTDVDAPHAANAVDIALAVGIEDTRALTARDDELACIAFGVEFVPGMQEVRFVQPLQAFGIEFLQG